MKKEFELLYDIQRYGYGSQRLVAERTGRSLGYVNQVLRRLETEGLLKKSGKEYGLTADGVNALEGYLHERQSRKLVVGKASKPIKEAVILAAGLNDNFDKPVPMLDIEGETLLSRIINQLGELGICRVCVVTGYKSGFIQKEQWKTTVEFVENPNYRWTGTMASLASAEKFVREDFLLVESNQIFERAALESVQNYPGNNAMLMVNPSGSMDEVYVELDGEGNIFRISKDICQMNRIDGELVGISRISIDMFRKMMDYYSHNHNPLINYEYVMEGLGRTYGIPAVRVDDLQWTVIENQEHYRCMQKWWYPRICRKEKSRQLAPVRELFARCMGIEESLVKKVQPGGGMTNSNFYVETEKEGYMLRIPGAGTDQMVNRRWEQQNSSLGEHLGINVPTVYFDSLSGVKISRYISGARTMNGKTARMVPTMRKTVRTLQRLHRSGLTMENTFDVTKEYENYKKQAEEVHPAYYAGFEEMDRWFYHLADRLRGLGTDRCTCHNDLVPENFIEDEQGRQYLIDWEYAGMNDPMWDLAAHLLESGFTREEEELFLAYYFEGTPHDTFREKIAIYKMMQDILWSIWTVLKEAKGEMFGTYGRDRLNRAMEAEKEYRMHYEQ